MSAVFELRSLSVGFANRGSEPTVVVRDVDLDLHAGQILGLAGETGCGKSTTAIAATGFPIPGAIRLGGSAVLEGVDLLSLPTSELRQYWGRTIAYVSQDAPQALSPLRRVGWLVEEPLRLHLGLKGEALSERALELLDSVGIPEPDRAYRRYPHEFSGGQQQRIAIAIAMACGPRVLILDEPTTGLDVTTQAQILELISRLTVDSGATALFISHDLAVLATVCSRLSIMYGGEIVESGPAMEVFEASRHPYAAALLDAVPRVDQSTRPVGIAGLPPTSVVEDACPFEPRCRFSEPECGSRHPELDAVAAQHEVRCLRAADLGVIDRVPASLEAASAGTGSTLLSVESLTCGYRRASAPAVDDVSIEIAASETLAVVGESGSGKTTLLRAVAGLHDSPSGEIRFDGEPLASRVVDRSRETRREIQLVFQNPHASLNPRHTVANIIERPLTLFQPDLSRRDRRARLLELLADVRLDDALLDRRPHQLSGGQKQRVALARAFAANPRLILCDEVVSALDVSVQASILTLLARLAAENGTALLFVTHDLAVVRSIADRVCVMQNGRVVETGATEELYGAPSEEYTQTLLGAVPSPTEMRTAQNGGLA